MRSIIVQVQCDGCGVIYEEDGPVHNIEFSKGTEKREVDLCEDCLLGRLWNASRPVVVKKTTRQPRPSARPGPGGPRTFVCTAEDCGRRFDTQRGLSKHENASH